MIEIEPHNLDIIRNILKEYAKGIEVRTFGSRIRGTARKFSDIDIALVGNDKLSDKMISDLKEALSNSDLPYKVDILDWKAISPEFRKTIENQGFEILKP